MDQNTIISIVEKYADLATQFLPVKKIYLFGSYAKGTADSDSDIDLAVIVEKIEGDILEPRVKLVELTHLVDIRIDPFFWKRQETEVVLLRLLSKADGRFTSD